MEVAETVIFMIEHTINTKSRRHIVGGILMGISLLFFTLGITVLTLKSEDMYAE